MQNEITPGQVLAGKYRVERVLGRGGMGVVVAAHHLQLDEKVAIKFLLPDAVTNAEVVGRFVREARAAVRIKSEHVARVSDVGTLEDGAPYMVMEYLEGSDLAAWVAQRGALPVEQAVEFLLQASEAIAEAHALGIVHRDLKPANLFVVRRADGLWSVKVLDFGISKVTQPGASDASLTRTTAVMGSPLYMPPEQMAASRNVDARSDIWALGVILYELLSGQVPFLGETLPEVCMKIATEPPAPIRRLRPEVPAALEAVILRCLEKDRERRFLNIAELALGLVDFGPKRARASVERITRTLQAAGLSASALALPPSSNRSEAAPAAPATVVSSGTVAPWGRTTTAKPEASRTVLVAAAAAAAVGLVALGGLGLGVKKALSPAPVRAEGSASAALGLASSAPPAAALAAPRDLVAPLASAAPSSAEPVIALGSAAPGASVAAPAAPHVVVTPPVTRTPVTRIPVKPPGPSTPPPPPPPQPAQKKGNIFDDR
jgi:eukaryotic-like serine/threonine-protein kinase